MPCGRGSARVSVSIRLLPFELTGMHGSTCAPPGCDFQTRKVEQLQLLQHFPFKPLLWRKGLPIYSTRCARAVLVAGRGVTVAVHVSACGGLAAHVRRRVCTLRGEQGGTWHFDLRRLAFFFAWSSCHWQGPSHHVGNGPRRGVRSSSCAPSLLVPAGGGRPAAQPEPVQASLNGRTSDREQPENAAGRAAQWQMPP